VDLDGVACEIREWRAATGTGDDRDELALVIKGRQQKILTIPTKLLVVKT
jgi:hypothetical protein